MLFLFASHCFFHIMNFICHTAEYEWSTQFLRDLSTVCEATNDLKVGKRDAQTEIINTAIIREGGRLTCTHVSRNGMHLPCK
jgi:hypothetical protein